MADYKTPGVYIEEISKTAPTAAEVPTAIPAFIGYTETASKGGTNVTNNPIYLSSLIEYQEIFGGDYSHKNIDVVLDGNKNIEKVEFEKQFYMFQSIRMFFANGGGQCCIISVGNYNDEIEKEKLDAGIDLLVKENLPTIIVLPDAMLLKSKEEAYAVQQKALMLCDKLKDRVTVLDIYDGYKDLDDLDDVIANFRTGIGINGLQFGAAYYPWIKTLFTTNFAYKNVNFKNSKGDIIDLKDLIPNKALISNLELAIADKESIDNYISNPAGTRKNLKTSYETVAPNLENKKGELIYKIKVLKDAAANLLKLNETKIKNGTVQNEIAQKTNEKSVFATLVRSLYSVDAAIKANSFDIKKDFVEFNLAKTPANEELAKIKDEKQLVEETLPILKNVYTNLLKLVNSVKQDVIDIESNADKAVFENVKLYKTAVGKIYDEASKLPPSGAIAGIYAQVDGSRGVWKAPANVSVSNIVKPWVKIDNDQQENLNVDPVGGKSVNAIRTFPGQGNLVWGARTLAGNDNEWRYISVRRFFNMAEKTLKQASSWAVFEPNVEMTWVRIKAMMNNFLTNLWKAGALQGATPADAFFVNIGLGTTMTQVDILEGRMIIEVGMAVVRPAEFIIIKFSHKVGGEGAE